MKIIKFLYIGFLSLFEFIVDILICILAVYILNICFEPCTTIKIINYIILFTGLVYGINDIFETYRKNNNDNTNKN